MIERIIEWSATHRLAVFAVTLLLVGWALDSVRKTPLDALPDLSDPQVIVFTEWMGRSPDLVEDQVTHPLVRALQATPKAVTVRGYSMFGMSFVYAIFEDGTDLSWARTRVLELLLQAQATLPVGAVPRLGPDATGLGWVFQYVVRDRTGALNLAELRALQDFTLRPALQAVPGVAEVASLGGFERQFQVVLDPARLAAFGLTPGEVSRAVGDANSEVGARVLELGGREYVVRARGSVKTLEHLEQSVVSMGPGGTPVRVRDVATVQFGTELRRGAADWNGEGEAVGGIVVMRMGSNALQVIEGVRAQFATLNLPDGVEVVASYDRSELILGSVETLTGTLFQQAIIVALVSLVFLFHARSALVTIVVLPVSVLLALGALRFFGLSSNIMSLGGIAIAVGELSDAVIVLVENAHVRLAAIQPGEDRARVIIDACKQVGRPLFFSLLLITVSFLPIFTLAGQAGRLFAPLTYTKTFAMFAASVLSVTLAPPLMVLLLRGRFRAEAAHPVTRFLGRLYRPVAVFVVRRRVWVLSAAALAMVGTVPLAARLGSEFMPPLDEGALLVMPTTFAGISLEEAKRVLVAQDRVLRSFPEVLSVHGKVGRAETATDPAQLDMIETVVTLAPRERWPLQPHARWYSGRVPEWLAAALRPLWPEQRPRSLEELSSALDLALRTPGFQLAIAPPIRTRIDMLSTGVRTPVGIKVFGGELSEIERLSLELEVILREVPGARSTFAERQTGREYVDIVPDRDVIARYGLTVREVNAAVEAAVGGMNVTTVIDGRARFPVSVRVGAGYRADAEGLRALLIPVRVDEPVLWLDSGGGAGVAAPVGGASPAADMAGMGAMGGGGARAMPATQGPAGMPARDDELEARWRQPGAVVPLGVLADVRVVSGPPMIKDENGVLVGYVYVDVDSAQRDLGGFVQDAKRLVAERLVLPAGYRLGWTGQYEFMAQMEARLRLVLPLTFALVVMLVFFSLRGWPQTGLVLLSLPFALAGSVWLLAALGYHLSTAVWVGLIAVAGVAAETGIVMIVYLDEALERRRREGRLFTPSDVDEAVVEGAAARVRPLVMTVATTVLGLLPLLWERGVGADITARTAAPVVGGLWSCMALTLLVLPAAYATWRRRHLRAAA